MDHFWWCACYCSGNYSIWNANCAWISSHSDLDEGCCSTRLLCYLCSLGPLYTRESGLGSQDHERPDPNNSILNLLLNLIRYFIKVHLGTKRGVWFKNCMEHFVKAIKFDSKMVPQLVFICLHNAAISFSFILPPYSSRKIITVDNYC
jgi:hypothetical protein